MSNHLPITMAHRTPAYQREPLPNKIIMGKNPSPCHCLDKERNPYGSLNTPDSLPGERGTIGPIERCIIRANMNHIIPSQLPSHLITPFLPRVLE